MGTSKFDIEDYLDSNEMIAEYLNAVLAEGDDSAVVTAIGHVAKSIGMTKIAQQTGLSRSRESHGPIFWWYFSFEKMWNSEVANQEVLKKLYI